MPLPANGTPWPPRQLEKIMPDIATWSAWYEGTPEALSRAYGGRTTNGPTEAGNARLGGVRGLLRRFWWGRTVDASTERPDQLHVPIASDLCRASADLLYAEPPTLTVTDGQDGAASATQERLNTYVDDGFHGTLATGAEVGAALSGRYHRVTWDQTVLDRPFLTTVDADAALPEFRWGRLVAVTFWHVLSADGQTVYRHLERHELDATGHGLILHGLYQGTTADLGMAIPLTDHAATAGLAPLVDETGALVAGRTPGLCVEYIPNQTPQRRWRRDPIGQYLGRSDLDGVEQLMDALDEAYSSLMRDVRLGKSRIIVPQHMLTNTGPGQGAGFNLDREVYEGLAMPTPEDGKDQITPQQFSIRVDEHLRTCADLTLRIVQTAGYSAQTLGETDTGTMTATEVHARERRSYLTRDRKIRLERPAVARLAQKMLSIDQAVFNTQGIVVQPVTVTFSDTVQDSMLELAQTVQALETARAASTETKVTLLHPDWGDDEVKAEVALINAQYALTVTDPDAPPPGTESTATGDGIDPAAVKAQADAMGVLIRAGVRSEDAAETAGLDGVEFTGAVPTSLRLPEGDAAGLEGQQ